MKLVMREEGLFIFKCEYKEKYIPKREGFFWSPRFKVWYTRNYKIARNLLSYADSEVKEFISKKEKEEREEKNNYKIVAPEGLSYKPFQIDAIKFALSKKNVLIADEMGLGKTIEALGICNSLNAKSILIICPCSLKKNWLKESEKWLLNKDLRIGILNGDNNFNACIINYDILHKYKEFIDSKKWDIAIVDEAHYCKNKKARRTQMVIGNKRKGIKPIIANKLVFLTGTPILNRPCELYSILYPLTDKFRNWKYFHTRYCNAVKTRWGWDLSGASNLEELNEQLKESVMIRRLKKDYLKDLPSKTRQIIELEPNGLKQLLKKQMAILKKAAKEKKISWEKAIERLSEGWMPCFDEMASIRKLIAIKKIPLVVREIKELLESISKVVVFAYHHEVIDSLVEELAEYGVVKLDGRDNIQQKDAAVKSFQENKDIKIFIGNIKAAGVGLTLTAASHVVFAELDWTPGNLSQAEDRLHRIGQSNSVQVYHLILNQSLDAIMIKKILEKQEVIEATVN